MPVDLERSELGSFGILRRDGSAEETSGGRCARDALLEGAELLRDAKAAVGGVIVIAVEERVDLSRRVDAVRETGEVLAHEAVGTLQRRRRYQAALSRRGAGAADEAGEAQPDAHGADGCD